MTSPIENGGRTRSTTTRQRLFDPEIEAGAIVAHELRSFLGKLARHPEVKLSQVKAGSPADSKTVARARRDEYMPAAMVGFCTVMDGIAFKWSFRTSNRRGGTLSIPPLLMMLNGGTGGIVLEEDGDEISRTARQVDIAASGTYKPICLEGNFGSWDTYNSCFRPQSSFSEYVRAGMANLFVPEWQDGLFGSRRAELVEAAEQAVSLLGL